MPSAMDIFGYSIYAGNTELFVGAKGVINTLNPHSYVLARKDWQFREALKSADWLIPDGVGIVMAVKFLNGKNIHRIAGSDLHETILRSLNEKKGSCFYLGSSERTLKIIREKVSLKFPYIRTGSFSPPFKEKFSNNDSDAMIEAANDFQPDVLFVGMTAPKQEKWVHEHRLEFNATLICCIGAVFDFYAGTVKRSGRIWIRLGLEWLPRLLREPRRLWKRNFISTPLFLFYVFMEKGKRVFGRIRKK